MYKKDCFAFRKMGSGHLRCSALNYLDCLGCKFYKTREDYNKNVAPIKYKKRKR